MTTEKTLCDKIREQHDYVDYLELTKRDKKRIEKAKRYLEVLHAYELQGHEYEPQPSDD